MDTHFHSGSGDAFVQPRPPCYLVPSSKQQWPTWQELSVVVHHTQEDTSEYMEKKHLWQLDVYEVLQRYVVVVLLTWVCIQVK